MVQSKLDRKMSGPAPSHRPRPERAFSADLAHRPNRRDLWRLTIKPEEEDVIDLGAPRKVRVGRSLGPVPPRASRVYTPNPRLYPGPLKPASQSRQKRKPNGPDGQRKKKTAFRRPVPNSRLYRPAPPRPLPPPAYPRTVWRPPTKGSLETASRVALRLSHGLWSPASIKPSVNTLLGGPPGACTRKPRRPTLRTRRSPTCSPSRHIKPFPPPLPPSPSQTQKLVITLPAAGDGNPPTGSDLRLRYPPASQHFRNRRLPSSPGDSTPTGGRVIHLSTRGVMDATPRHSTSPEDCSEGNDSHSAPSEFLAEFLSAIMRRQYAEALKYCRLILQYEPRNATARGFYPLLQQKLAQQSPREARDKPAARARHQRSPHVSRSPELGKDSYVEALKYCRLILQYEPRNATARGFYPLLQQKLAQQSPREARDKPAARARHQRSPHVSRSSELGKDSYVEALKYCRLILQYEPRNATARGFYPLLQQKLAQQSPREARDKPAARARHQRSPHVSHSPELAGGSSGGNSGESSPIPPGILPHEVMEQEADSLSGSEARPGSAGSSEAEPGLGSVSSQSSLELDSSEPARSSPSLSLSRRTDRTDSASASGTWDSSGSGARDDNGNPAPAPLTAPRPCCDAENNAPATSKVSPLHAARARPLSLQSEQSTESLRRLRAQFACSIK